MKPAPMTELSPELVEKVARAIAPRIFYEFDADTMDRASNWEAHSEKDRETMRLIAQDALNASTLADENAMLRERLSVVRQRLVGAADHQCTKRGDYLYKGHPDAWIADSINEIDTALSHKETNR